MAFTLKNVVPWGRSYAEYVKMFSLTSGDLDRKIIGVGDGPSGFNQAMTAYGKSVVSVDPLYQFSVSEIKQRIDETSEEIMEQLDANRDAYVWDDISSPEELKTTRFKAMNLFLSDYENGKMGNRYFNQSLPSLQFQDNSFDLALCSHFLFLYSDKLTVEFHIESVLEMLRIAKEVRIFPLADLAGNPSPYVESVSTEFMDSNYKVTIEQVGYEFQKGVNEMMRIIKQT